MACTAHGNWRSQKRLPTITSFHPCCACARSTERSSVASQWELQPPWIWLPLPTSPAKAQRISVVGASTMPSDWPLANTDGWVAEINEQAKWSMGAWQPDSHMAQGRPPAQSSEPSIIWTRTPAFATSWLGPPLKKRALISLTIFCADDGLGMGRAGAGGGAGSYTTSSETKSRRLAPSSRSVTKLPRTPPAHATRSPPMLGSLVTGPAHLLPLCPKVSPTHTSKGVRTMPSQR
mmetsp:Transcript_1077/g.3583  ORF Transcript_1077/g.3583 Transcript_1077/m.3583 type:complete len:234 (-) Transcript_1077:504-1205(-)